MRKWLLTAALVLVVSPNGLMAQSKASLVGTWKLVSIKQSTDTGEDRVTDMFGPNPIGFLTYTDDGRVSVIIAKGGRKPIPYFPVPSAEEIAKAYSTFIAYAGSYTFSGDKVIHHIEAASHQNIVNTDQVRSVKLQGDRLTLRWGPHMDGRVAIAYTDYVWERMKLWATDKKSQTPD